MSKDTLACRLIKACNLAYSMTTDGKGLQDTTQVQDAIKDIGFSKNSLKFFQAPNDDRINACYYGETQNEAILTFRGTLPPTVKSPEEFFRSLQDWLNDAEIKLVQGTNLAGLVHSGFLESLDALWVWIDQLKLGDVVKSGKSLLITGHSKGGALTYLAAYRLAKMGIPVKAAYSYAAPRPGNQAFADAFQQMVDTGSVAETCRFEYQDDIMPHLPPSTGSWRVIQNGLEMIQEFFPFDAPHFIDSPQAVVKVNNFLSRLDAIRGYPTYASVGKLQFINWKNTIEGDSLVLATERNLNLAKMMVELKFG